MRTSRVFRPFAAIAMALLLGACSAQTADLGPIQNDLQTQARAQSALRDRIEELESLVMELGTTKGGDVEALSASLDERASSLESLLSELRVAIEDERLSRQDGDASTTATLADIKKTLSGLQGSIGQLDTDIKKLRSDHDLLRAEYDRHTD